MQELPIGVQDFEKIRRNNYLYVDKTEKLLQLAKTEKSYFLSRPRRFGKSLTLSTLEAMFQGEAELFKGLYAEEWVKEQSKHPSPVIKLDMSLLAKYKDGGGLNNSLINYLVRYYIKKYKLDIVVKDNYFCEFFQNLEHLLAILAYIYILLRIFFLLNFIKELIFRKSLNAPYSFLSFIAKELILPIIYFFLKLRSLNAPLNIYLQ